MLSQAGKGSSVAGRALARLAQTGSVSDDALLQTARRLALAGAAGMNTMGMGDMSGRGTEAALVAGALSGATPEQLELLGAGRNPMVVTEGGGATKFRKLSQLRSKGSDP